MNAILLALLAAVGFSGASLLALLGGEVRAKERSYSAAVAAGILLALAFVDLFPEGLELAGEAAIVGFVGGFALLFLTEAFTGAQASAVTAGLVGLGVLVHQVPVGISLAAVLLVARATRAAVVRTAVLLGLAIPLAAALTVGLPVPGEGTLGLLIGIAGGILAYMGAAHLLPEAQAEHPSGVTAGLFAATLVLTTFCLMTVLGD